MFIIIIIIIRNGAKTISLQTNKFKMATVAKVQKMLNSNRTADPFEIWHKNRSTLKNVLFNGYQFSLKSENIEILPILSAANLKMAAIRSRFFLVRIFYQPYLILLCLLHFLLCPPNEVSGDILCLLCFLLSPQTKFGDLFFFAPFLIIQRV
jgi:hypothetical protein